MAKLAFNHLVQWSDGNGDPYSGAQLFTYAAGSSTKATTYQDSGSSTAHANPIVLDANGRIPSAIWLTEGTSYKFVLAPSDDTDPPASPIWTLDGITGINDASVSLEQWSDSGFTPTYVSATQFTVAGDQTSTLHVGRRVKIVDGGGTKYGYITVSAFTTLTTVTVSLDSGSLETPTSTLYIGVQTTTDPSEPLLMDTFPLRSGSSDRTKKARLELDNITTATTRVLTVQDKDATLPALEDTTRPWNAYITASVESNILTIAVKTRAGNDPSAGDPAFIPFRDATSATGSYTVLKLTAALSIAIPDTATLGTVNDDMARLYVYAINDDGTARLGVYNPVSGTGSSVALKGLNVSDVVSSSQIGTSSDSAQTLYTNGAAVTSKAACWLGFVEIVEATAGTWATAPTLVANNRLGVPYTGHVLQVVNDIEESGSTTTSSSAADVTGASVAITAASRCNLLECHIDYAQINSSQTAAANSSFCKPTDGSNNDLRSEKEIQGTDTGSNIIVEACGSFHFYVKPDSTSSFTVKLRHRNSTGSDTVTTKNVGIMVKEVFA